MVSVERVTVATRYLDSDLGSLPGDILGEAPSYNNGQEQTNIERGTQDA